MRIAATGEMVKHKHVFDIVSNAGERIGTLRSVYAGEKIAESNQWIAVWNDKAPYHSNDYFTSFQQAQGTIYNL